jgi:hypothetical protein
MTTRLALVAMSRRLRARLVLQVFGEFCGRTLPVPTRLLLAARLRLAPRLDAAATLGLDIGIDRGLSENRVIATVGARDSLPRHPLNVAQ